MGIEVAPAKDGTVSLITMDDGKANAFTKENIATLIEALDQAAADPAVSAVVIAGRENRFSGGFDLNVMHGGDFATIVDLVADGGELVRYAFTCDIPVVAASTGHAIAAGALLLLGCDVRVGAAGDYKIGVNEVAIGMVLPDWAMTICRERISKRHLQRCVANAQISNPNQAVDVGFLDEVVPAAQVIDRAVEVASELSALDPSAYAGTMKAFRSDVGDLMAEQIAADRASARS